MIRPAFVVAMSFSMTFNVWTLQHAWKSGEIGTDFAVFWRAANSAIPYAPSLEPFGSPPTALLFFQVFRLAPQELCLLIWTLFGLAAFAISSKRLYNMSALLLTFVSAAAIHCLVAGQISLIVAALIFSAFLAPAWVCGSLLAVAICLKPQMAFLAPLLFIFTRRWGALASLAMMGGLLCAIATAAFGFEIWFEWQEGVATLLTVAEDRGAYWLSVSPVTFGSPWLWGLPWMVALPAGAAALFTFRNAPPATQAAVLTATSAFASPYALTYDLVVVAPLAATVLLSQRGLNSWGAAAAFIAVFGPLGPVGALLAARERPQDDVASAPAR